jgi:alkylation response protein AidB-like acyl-CoA dehydrogenase
VSGRNLLAPGSTAAVNTAAVLARSLGVEHDPVVRQLVGEQRMIDLVQRGLVERVTLAVRTGALPPPAASLLKLYTASASVRKTEIATTISGPTGALWAGGDGAAAALADKYLIRQADAISGGTSEIQRNIISERVLGMPKEPRTDAEQPFSSIKKGG